MNDQRSIDDRRDDIAALTGSGGLLRRVHDDSLAPAGRPPEVHVTTSGHVPDGDSQEPRAGDPQGYANYQAACRELAHVWRNGMTRLDPPVTVLPPFVAEGRIPTPYEADQAARALAPFLDDLGQLRAGEHADGRGPPRRGGVLLAIKRAREALDAAAGATHRPQQILCEVCRSNPASAGKAYGVDNVCWTCRNHRRDHGEWPVHAHTA